MGMFDTFYVHCHLPCRIPIEHDPRTIQYQTKDWGQSLDQYRINWDRTISRCLFDGETCKHKDEWEHVPSEEVAKVGYFQLCGGPDSGVEPDFDIFLGVRCYSGKVDEFLVHDLTVYTKGWREAREIEARARDAERRRIRSMMSVDARDRLDEFSFTLSSAMKLAMAESNNVFCQMAKDHAPMKAALRKRAKPNH